MDLKERAKIVRNKRDELGFTQIGLAVKANVSPSYIQKLEAGTEDRNNRADHLRRVAVALGFDSEYLRIPRIAPTTFGGYIIDHALEIFESVEAFAASGGRHAENYRSLTTAVAPEKAEGISIHIRDEAARHLKFKDWDDLVTTWSGEVPKKNLLVEELASLGLNKQLAALSKAWERLTDKDRKEILKGLNEFP